MTVSEESIQQLGTLLSGLASTDNGVRERSEKLFEQEWMQARPSLAMPTLCAIIVSPHSEATIKSLAAIVFRRGISKIDSLARAKVSKDGVPRLWHALPVESQNACCQLLLEAWQKEASKDVRNKISDALAEVCRIISVHEEWTQFLTLVWSINANTHSPEVICSALRIIESVPECLQNQKVETISAYLVPFFGNPDVNVKLSAVKVLLAIVTTVADDKKMGFLPLINQLPEFLSVIAASGDEEVFTESIQAIVEMTDDCPKLFKGLPAKIIPVLCAVIAKENFEEETKGVALELVTSLCESNPAAVRKQKELTGTICNLLLSLISNNLSGDQVWYEITPEDENEEEALSLAGEQALDRVAIALGGKSLLPILMGSIPAMLNSTEWKHRYAALRSIANMAEGCADLLADRLDELLSLVWPAFTDKHPRVQYAACHALGQLCTDFAGPLQEHFASQCLSSLVGVLVNSGQPRVQCHAAAALINFAEGVDAAIIAPILDGLLERLVTLLSTNTLYLQEQVIATMAAFSSASGTSFSRFVPQVVPMLMGCLNSTLDRTYRQLQCRALEAATMIAAAVGKEAFAPFSPALLDFMVKLTQSELEDDDLFLDYLPGSWVRMCQVLKGEFIPFLPLILPRLLEDAKAEPDIAVIDAADPNAEEEYDPAEWEFATVRGRRLGIHTATLDAKAMAVENLAIYIGTLEADFNPYVRETFETLLPLVEFNMHEGVQSASAEALASLIKCCTLNANADAVTVVDMTTRTLKTLFDQLKTVSIGDAEVAVAFLDSIADIINIRPTSQAPEVDVNPLIPIEVLSACFKQIDTIITMLVKNQGARQRQQQDEDDEEDLDDDDESLMYGSTRLAAALFRNFKNAALGPGENLLQFCLRCLLQGKTPLFKHACLCILDDLVHYMGQDSAPISQYISQCFMAGLNDEEIDSRQAAVFGIGMCAEYAPALYEQSCLNALPRLLEIINHPDSKAPSLVTVTDNSMSAVARIAQAYPSKTDFSSLIPQWLKGLPVTHDEDEVPIVYRWLLTLYSTQPQLLFQNGNAESGSFVLRAFADVIIKECPLAADLRSQIISVIANLRQQLPQALVQSTLAQFYTPEQIAKL